jgi:multisubunit Na+/H+ antiporter MnhG subunit
MSSESCRAKRHELPRLAADRVMPVSRVVQTVTRWPFLAALGLLLFNDFWLKAQWPGLVTGKLSDFAGIAMVALPCLAAFPRRAPTIYLAIAAAFLWWKSPLSGAFIALANAVLPYEMGRVVDYSDLLALLVLPCCSIATRRVRGEPGGLRRASTIPLVALAVFATAATSMPRPQVDLTVRTVDPGVPLDRAATADAIESVMKAYRLPCIECAERERKATYAGRDVGINYQFLTDNSVHVRLSAYVGMFGSGEIRLVKRIRRSLKDEFTKRFKGLEAVEPLRGVYDGMHDRPPPAPCDSEASPAPHCTATGQPAPTGPPPH